ncbi:MAG: hypothetical protein RPU63_02300 [Candidatus Sedimenticola sp. (ex Thyasira tokunagai)]
MSYQDWKRSVIKVPVFMQSAELKKLTLAYRLLDQRLTPANIEGLKIAYETWIGCNQYNAEIMRIGTLAVLDLRVAANIKTTSAYDPPLSG